MTPNQDILGGYKIDNLTVKCSSLTDERKKYYNKIKIYIENGNIFKLPKHMTVLDILRCPTHLKPLLASLYGYVGLIQHLVDNGYQLDCRTNDNDTIFMVACYNGHDNVVEYLIQNGININMTNKLNENGYLFATGTSPEFLDYLEKKGLNINQKNKFNEDALVYSIDKGKLSVIKYLVETKGFKPSNMEIDLLTRACYHNSTEMISYLCDLVDKPDLFGCYYWTLIHNNREIWEILNKKYQLKIGDIHKHNLNLFQNMTNLFIFINFRPFSKLMKQYNSIQKWSILNYLENKVDINNVTPSQINSFMVVCSSGNIQLIDYYRNKYNYSLTQRNDTNNDLYTLAICNKCYSLVKYLSLSGLNMEFININYINYKKNRYYYDIYTLYYNYLNRVKLIIDDVKAKELILTDFSHYNNSSGLKGTNQWYHNNIIKTLKKEDIDDECVICKETFVHMDEVIRCSNNHICHAVCLMTSLNNKLDKYADCLICFEKTIMNPNNLYIWFTKPNIDYLKQRQLEKEDYSAKLQNIDKLVHNNQINSGINSPDYIYPIYIDKSQFDYGIEDLSVVPNQDVEKTNLNSFNMCFTVLYDIYKYIDKVMDETNKMPIFDKKNINELCTYLDMGWYNIYRSLVEKEDSNVDIHIDNEEAAEVLQNNPELLGQLLQQINNNQQNNQVEVNNNDEIQNNQAEVDNNEEPEDNNQIEVDDILNDDIEDEEYDDIEDDFDIEDTSYEYEDDDPYLEPIETDDNVIFDDLMIQDDIIEGPVFGIINNKSEYDRLNVFMNNLYYKHMIRKLVIDRYVLGE